MKLAVQLGMLPGRTVSDRAKWARDQGVEGIEQGIFGTWIDKLEREADQIAGRVPICSVCGNSTPDGGRAFDFLDADPAKRRAAIDASKAVLEYCGRVGAVGQIVPPIFGPPVVPDLSPVMDPIAIEDKLMVAACRELGPVARANKAVFMLEPLNRYESHYLRTQADAVRVMRQANVRGIGLLSDFFHMHIEETDTPVTFRQIGRHTSHVHLADNTRMEPGTGDIDFVPALRELHKHGFKGYMAYECGVTGKTNKQRATNLAKSLDYMRGCIRKAKR